MENKIAFLNGIASLFIMTKFLAQIREHAVHKNISGFSKNTNMSVDSVYK